MRHFDTLYKKTTTGAIQFWSISAVENQIITRYGQVGTESPQETVDVITKGKNVGRSNETTREQQAFFEAHAKWTKQLKKGYVKSREAAETGELDVIIEGGIEPMTAHKYKDHPKKMKFPCMGQPKLDGIRCTAEKKNGVCTLWTRTRKQIHSMPHIIAAIEKMFPGDVELDGELYNHDYKDDFENIIELVRPNAPVPGHEVVQYHLYDVPMEGGFEQRYCWLSSHIEPENPTLILVETRVILTADDVDSFHDLMVSWGYEGAMLRNKDGKYIHHRSYDLLKVKKFETDEFPILGFEEGRGRLKGHVGSFLCETKDGKRFYAKQKGKLANLKKYFIYHDLWKGKKLTVQYQNLTQDGIPRFPVGIAIRDYE
jgi:DNA ligase 1